MRGPLIVAVTLAVLSGMLVTPIQAQAPAPPSAALVEACAWYGRIAEWTARVRDTGVGERTVLEAHAQDKTSLTP
jgi:hypothetical protein